MATEDERMLGFSYSPSKLENIDAAMFSYLKKLNLYVMTNNGSSPVPVIWTTAERSFQAKNDSRIRDKSGSLILPIITAERTAVTKDRSRKGSVQAALVAPSDKKGGVIPVARILKQDKTSNFLNADSKKRRGQLNFPRLKNEKIVYETIYIPLPVYVIVNYEITLRTEYQQQMNELIIPFIRDPGGVSYILIDDDSHRYEGFIQQEFAHSNNINSYTTEERKYETKINVEILGHLYDGGRGPHIAVRENAVDLKMPRERVMTRDEAEREIGKYTGSTIVTNVTTDID